MECVTGLCCALATTGVVEVVALSLGFVALGIYDHLADKLFTGGDLVDEALREIIVRNSNQIKSKIEYLALTDLKTSCSYLCIGLEFLNLSRGTSTEAQKKSEAAGGFESDSKTVSEKRFLSAKDYFKESRKAATQACNNKALKIRDRIHAFELRMAATILETGFEDPEATIIACRIALEELHSLEEVQGMFKVVFKQGLKSKLKAKLKYTQRLENIRSVLLLNYNLVFYAYDQLKGRKYSELVNLYKQWPLISPADCTIHPIYDAYLIPNFDKETFIQPTLNVFKNAFGELSQRIERVIEDPRISRCECFTVNSVDDIILLNKGKVTILYHTGETKDIKLPEDNPERSEMERGLAVDNNDLYMDSKDNIFVVRLRQQLDRNGINKRREYLLYVIDMDHIIVSFVLKFLQPKEFEEVQIAVDQLGNLVIMKEHDNKVYKCDDTGRLKSCFQRNGTELFDLGISVQNDIMIVSDDRRAVQVYTTVGDFDSKVVMPDGHRACRVVFHYRICKMIVLAHVTERDSWVLLYYGETGELENSVTLCHSGEAWKTVNMASSPNGRVALRCGNTVTFLNEFM